MPSSIWDSAKPVNGAAPATSGGSSMWNSAKPVSQPSAPSKPAPAATQQTGPVGAFFGSVADAINPIPAIEEWLNRPSEMHKAMAALPVLDKKIAGQKLSPAEQKIIDDAMNAHLTTAEDATPMGAAPAIKAATQVVNGDPAGAAGTLVGGYALPVAAGKVVQVAAPVAQKYGARVVANSPAVGSALVDAGKAVALPALSAAGALALPGYFKGLSALGVIKAGQNLVKAGTFSDLRSAVSDLLSRPTIQEVMEASKARGESAPWRQFPDVAQETQEEVTPIPSQLPSGRIAGGIQNQQPTLAPVASQPRQAPVWQRSQAQAPAPAVQVSTAPSTPASQVVAVKPALASGRTVGGIQNQTKTITVNPAAKATATVAIDPATTQKLAEAANTGKLEALPAPQKAALTQAVKTGDVNTINSILNGRAHEAVNYVDQATQNKVAVLAKYIKDHGVEMSSVTPDAMQALADAAYAHGVKNSMIVPKKGYRGISGDTWTMVKQAVNQ